MTFRSPSSRPRCLRRRNQISERGELRDAAGIGGGGDVLATSHDAGAVILVARPGGWSRRALRHRPGATIPPAIWSPSSGRREAGNDAALAPTRSVRARGRGAPTAPFRVGESGGVLAMIGGEATGSPRPGAARPARGEPRGELEEPTGDVVEMPWMGPARDVALASPAGRPEKVIAAVVLSEGGRYTRTTREPSARGTRRRRQISPSRTLESPGKGVGELPPEGVGEPPEGVGDPAGGRGCPPPLPVSHRALRFPRRNCSIHRRRFTRTARPRLWRRARGCVASPRPASTTRAKTRVYAATRGAPRGPCPGARRTMTAGAAMAATMRAATIETTTVVAFGVPRGRGGVRWERRFGSRVSRGRRSADVDRRGGAGTERGRVVSRSRGDSVPPGVRRGASRRRSRRRHRGAALGRRFSRRRFVFPVPGDDSTAGQRTRPRGGGGNDDAGISSSSAFRLVGELGTHAAPIACVETDAECALLAVGDASGTVSLVDLRAGLLRFVTSAFKEKSGESVAAAAFLPPVVGTEDEPAPTPNADAEPADPPDRLRTRARWVQRGAATLVLAGTGSSVAFLDARTGAPVGRVSAQNTPSAALAVAPLTAAGVPPSEASKTTSQTPDSTPRRARSGSTAASRPPPRHTPTTPSPRSSAWRPRRRFASTPPTARRAASGTPSRRFRAPNPW